MPFGDVVLFCSCRGDVDSSTSAIFRRFSSWSSFFALRSSTAWPMRRLRISCENAKNLVSFGEMCMNHNFTSASLPLFLNAFILLSSAISREILLKENS